MKKKQTKCRGDIRFPKYQSDAELDRYTCSDPQMTASCVLIKDALIREGYSGPQDFSSQRVLDLDKYEVLTCGALQEKTVDFVLGCENMVLLLCEAKFRVLSVERFVKELPAKIRHSKGILCSNNSFVSAFPVTVVLLPDKNFYQNERKFNNLFSNNLKMAKVMTVRDFYRNIFC